MIRLVSSVVICVSLLTQAALAQSPDSEKGPMRGRGRGMRGGAPEQAAPQQAPKPIPTQEELFKQLSETLTGATLVGFFTTAGTDSDHPLREDKYTLGKVYKLPDGDFWQFEAKIGTGSNNQTFPLAVEVKWAGDTPMIQLTEQTIPLMGTYTARVFLYQNQYAGTWKHGPAGGQMFGKIVKEKKEGADKPAEAAK